MAIADFFSTSCETRELHQNGQLRTRYYRNSFKQCFEALEELANREILQVRDVNEHHGEVYLLGNGYDCIVTVIQLSPIETSVDFKINYFSFIGLSRPKKRAIQFYKFLDSVLKFKGVSLHP
ncbi:MAG: hypothetical protein KJ971_03050 [Firmicutes bacterium]|nr:hypothetical protein [Bacillota bacterium]